MFLRKMKTANIKMVFNYTIKLLCKNPFHACKAYQVFYRLTTSRFYDASTMNFSLYQRYLINALFVFHLEKKIFYTHKNLP